MNNAFPQKKEAWGPFGRRLYFAGMRQAFALWVILLLPATSSAQSERLYFFDSNVGSAFIEGFFEGWFPGASILGGIRQVSSNRFEINGKPRARIWEAELGFAAPAGATGKVGVGFLNEMTGGSTTLGVRLFPLHGYIQKAFGTRRCERDVSPRMKRRLEKRGRDRNNLRCSDWYFTFEVGGGGEWSFDSYSIVSVGHRMFFD